MANAKILIMDDEEIILDVVGNMLEYLGYEVEFSSDGQTALDKYRDAMLSRRPFDVVIMDLTIPGGRGGREVIKDLLVLDPAVKAIVSSGYSNDPVMSNYPEYGFKAAVRKPFKMEDLRDVLLEILNTE